VGETGPLAKIVALRLLDHLAAGGAALPAAPPPAIEDAPF
jgi:hypothetical protein